MYEGGTNVIVNKPGHMTKMAAMPIYGKTLQKSSSQELLNLLQWGFKILKKNLDPRGWVYPCPRALYMQELLNLLQ